MNCRLTYIILININFLVAENLNYRKTKMKTLKKFFKTYIEK